MAETGRARGTAEADVHDEPATGQGRAPARKRQVDLADHSLYFNRELSWVDFDDRVLQLAEDPKVPLLERVKFCAIYGSNLDEFFMVRVAALHEQVEAGVDERGPDGVSASDAIDGIREKVVRLARRLHAVIEHDLRPALAEHGIRIVTVDAATPQEREALAEHFRRTIFPVLTPLAVGFGRPFPYISNLSLSLGVLLRDPESDDDAFARIKVPKEILPRFVALDDGLTFATLEDVIAHHLEELFPGMEILDFDSFRVTRDADFTVSDEADDLLQALEGALRRRRFGEVVRMEIGSGMHTRMRRMLTSSLDVADRSLYEVDGLMDVADLWALVKLPGFPELRHKPWSPVTQPRLQGGKGRKASVMAAMRDGDILVHHPYDSFHTSVERLVEEAIDDPDVLAIKQTVYRTSDDTTIVPALIRASERGKQAVCMVELKARFDERANIEWGRALEEAGVHVVYGIPSLKTHAKCVLIIRREGDGVRHYVHVGTGNYNHSTARLYTDFGLLTTDDEIGADAADMFNYLTGFAHPRSYRRLLVAPHALRDGILTEIDRTIAAHSDERPARIAMKMNSLVDGPCISALYRASQAGVKVDINVRGICCLRPGVPGVSEHIRVVSVVGRFLEHSRIYSFERDGERHVYMGSADLMPRNLDHRVELVAPLLDPAARAQLLDTLERNFADNMNSWDLQENGEWVRNGPDDGKPRDVHRELMRQHAARASEGAAG